MRLREKQLLNQYAAVLITLVNTKLYLAFSAIAESANLIFVNQFIVASVYKGILHKTTKNGLPTY